MVTKADEKLLALQVAEAEARREYEDLLQRHRTLASNMLLASAATMEARARRAEATWRKAQKRLSKFQIRTSK